VNILMNLGVPRKGISQLAERLLASQEGLYSMQLDSDLATE
jgi:hypothetical protein